MKHVKTCIASATALLTLVGFTAPTSAQMTEGAKVTQITQSYQDVLGSYAINPGKEFQELIKGQASTTADHDTVVLEEDDRLWNVSNRLGVDALELMAINIDADPLKLTKGMELKVPKKVEMASQETAEPATDSKPEQPSQQNQQAPQQTSKPAKPAAKTEAVKPEAKTPNNKETAASGNSLTTASGKTVNYSKMVNMKATAYSGDPSENGPWGGVDSFGNKLTLGTIAVDPKVIPLGSTVYITGYSFPGLPAKGMIAKAVDTGSAIKGNKIDIYIPGSKKHVNNFGVQQIQLYVLK